MSDVKHTPGPFTVRQPNQWPFDIEVVNADGEVVWSERRYAHSTRQKSVDDCMKAVGFDYDKRPEIIEMLQRQVADITLRAAAPDLLEALQDLLAAYSEPDQQLCCDGRDCGCMGSTVRQLAEHYARAAIAKATQP